MNYTTCSRRFFTSEKQSAPLPKGFSRYNEPFPPCSEVPYPIFQRSKPFHDWGLPTSHELIHDFISDLVDNDRKALEKIQIER